jgi:predicted secreted hydrolase
MPSTRRQWLRATLPWLCPIAAQASTTDTAPAPIPRPAIRAGEALRFPLDFGAHPAFRTEWWYLTGTLQTHAPSPRPLGFQITFFRSRVDSARASASRFAARQLIFAHAALSDVRVGHLLHDQRIARAGFGLAEAREGDTRVTLRDWHLQRQGTAQASVYEGRVAARDFTLDLRCTQTQPLLLQGQQGYSRKGPQPEQASHYYSQPQLRVQGRVLHQGQWLDVNGTAWLDHEWSESLLDREAVGWDWIGMNLHDGGALMAFRLRRRDGSTLWAGGTWRAPGQTPRSFSAAEVHFTPGRTWTSPASGARYPVSWTIALGDTHLRVQARMDHQELDSRQSTGGIYWEGLSDLLDAQGRVIGHGYLEMTGYAAPMRL